VLASLDLAYSDVRDSVTTLTGLPGGAPALLPRSNIIQRSSFIAPQGVWLRPNTTTSMQESSFHGNLIVDGTVDGFSLDGLHVFGSLSGSGTIEAGTRLFGPDAQLNPGPIGAPGLLTVGNLGVFHDPDHPETGYGKFVFELGPADFDRLIVTRDLTLGGTLSVSFLGGLTLGPDRTFPIIDLQGTLLSSFPGLDEGDTVANLNGWDLHISYTGGNGNDVVLYTVPEPSAAIYLTGLGAVLLGKRRRQR
jgi:hypothetical protein